MANVVQIVDTREADASARFSNYVQSIAFTLTLSRTMIETLRVVRDFGWPLHYTTEEHDKNRAAMKAVHGNGQYDLVTPFRALERRGLAYHAPSPGYSEMRAMTEAERKKWNGHRHYRLTKAGSIVCDLLVEAGLLPAQEKKRRRA